MVSSKAVRQALYTTLNKSSLTGKLANGSASLIHAVAPPETDYPYVVFNKQSGRSVHRFGGNAFDSQLWLVKGIARGGTSSVAEDIAEAISDLLDFQDLSITGGSFMHLARESDVDFVETEGDQTYRHHGSLYRLVVQD